MFGEDDLAAVRQMREQLARRPLRRRREVELAADQERLDVRVAHRVYWFSSGFAGQASTSRPPAQIRSVPGLPMIDPRSASAEEAPGVGRVDPGDRGDVTPELLARERHLRHQRQEPRTASVALVGGEQRVDRPGRASGPAPSVVAFIRPKNAAALTCPSLIGRNHQWSGMSRRPTGARPRGPASAPAGGVLRAERGVAADLLVGRLRVPEEVAGRVDRDHHRPVDAPRVAPGVDHRGARPGALAQEVDAAVAERLARGLEVVDPLREAVAGEIDAVVREPVGARPKASARSRKDFSVEEVGRALERRLDLRAVEHRGAVHAAVADEDDVVLVGEPARLVNSMFVMPGPPWRRKIGSAGCSDRARMRVTGSAIRRDCGSGRFSGTTSVPQSAA